MAITLSVDGMSCGHCEQTVEEALAGVAGVTAATADRQAGVATVEGDVDVAALVHAVEDAGYAAEA